MNKMILITSILLVSACAVDTQSVSTDESSLCQQPDGTTSACDPSDNEAVATSRARGRARSQAIALHPGSSIAHVSGGCNDSQGGYFCDINVSLFGLGVHVHCNIFTDDDGNVTDVWCGDADVGETHD